MSEEVIAALFFYGEVFLAITTVVCAIGMWVVVWKLELHLEVHNPARSKWLWDTYQGGMAYYHHRHVRRTGKYLCSTMDADDPVVARYRRQWKLFLYLMCLSSGAAIWFGMMMFMYLFVTQYWLRR